jgi:acylphosphatase
MVASGAAYYPGCPSDILWNSMRRLIANVFGDLGGAGYSAFVVTLAGTLDLKGYIEILADGRAFIIAEGEEEDLERFARAIYIDNKRIRVKEILADYREPTGEFSEFQDILFRQDKDKEPEKIISVALTCSHPLVPDKMEKPDTEISETNQHLARIDSGLERLEQSIETSEDERPATERCKLEPEMREKLSLNK